MATPLYPTFEKRVNDAVKQLIRQQVTPWVFLTTGRPLNVSTFDGRQIHYEDVAFEGSPREVFWGRYIEPFLEDLTISEIAEAVSMARDRGVDGRLLLPELRMLLSTGYRKVYMRMADVDRRLLGKGCPDRVGLKSIEPETHLMGQFLDERIRAELTMWKPKSNIENWFKRNTFWAWAIGLGLPTILAIVGLLVTSK